MNIEITILGIMTTILAMAVIYLAWKNGKVTRENTEKILEASSENTEKILKAIKESSKIIALLILSETPEEKKELANYFKIFLLNSSPFVFNLIKYIPDFKKSTGKEIILFPLFKFISL